MASIGPDPGPGRSHLPTELHAVLRGHEGPVLAARFNRNGAYVLTAGRDRTFRLWNPYKGLLVKTYAGHAHEVRDVTAAADNSRCGVCATNHPGGDRLTRTRRHRRRRGDDA